MISKLFLRILKQYAYLFVLLPLITAGTVALLTQNQKKTYLSQATIYTGLASGYSLNANKNNASFDYSGVSNAFDNLLTALNSKETLHQIAVSLLAKHLQVSQPDTLVLAVPGFDKLKQAIPDPLRREMLSAGSPALIYARIDSLSRSEKENPVKALLFRSETYYSVNQIAKKLIANRKSSSDMLEMSYEADDAAVAQQTLQYAIGILNARYTALKSADSNPVVTYYEDKSKEAKRRLDEAEARLRSFNVQHEVLNFDEEAKNMAFSRETFENQYNLELMRNNAAKAAMDALIRRMGQRGNLLAINSDMVKKQQELSDAELQLVTAMANNQDKTKLQETVARISEELRTIARRYYAAGDSPESIPQEKLIDEWLAKVIEFEESAARIGVYKKRLGEYQAKTKEYSPLGSDLRELNRDLSVAEKEYLTLLQSLNEARIHRQDVSIDGELKILDQPNYPASQKKTSRIVFIGGGIGVGLFLALLVVVMRFLLDRRISSPDQAESLIGRPVSAIFPVIKRFSLDARKSRIALSMYEQLCNAINVDIARSTSKIHPPVITLISMRAKQGKTWVAHGLARLYAESDQRIAYCFPRQSDEDHGFEQENVTFFPYRVLPGFMNTMSVDELIRRDYPFNPTDFDKIILELPAFINSPIPVYLVNQTTVAVMVADANSVWGRVEKNLLDLYLKVANHHMLLVLNKVDGEYTEAPSVEEARMVRIQPDHLNEGR